MYRRLSLALLFCLLPCQAQTFQPANPYQPFSVDQPIPRGDVFSVITWSQVSGGNGSGLTGVVRAVVYGGAGAHKLPPPMVIIDHTSHTMTSRIALNPSTKRFPVGLFEYPIKAGQQSISVVFPDGSSFSAPPLVEDVKLLGVIGDTGCSNNENQPCDTQQSWPFRTLAENLAARKPQLVLHVGDLLYTPALENTCDDYWQPWLSGFLIPALSLLSTAPLAISRGNHEGCDCKLSNTNHGSGFFFLLQQGTAQQSDLTCDKISPHNQPPVWYFDVGATRFFSLDSAAANDIVVKNLDTYKSMVAEIQAAASGFEKGIIFSHKPLWGAKNTGRVGRMNKTLQAAFGSGGPPDSIALMLAGHIHTHQVLAFKESDQRPIQLVTGNTGAPLNGTVENKTNCKKIRFQGYKARVSTRGDFGYDLWAHNPGADLGWDISFVWLEFKNGEPIWVVTQFED